MMTKLRIISRLWSHITDLRLYIRGQSSKTLEQIEDELDITEYYCRPYADVDDVDDVFSCSRKWAGGLKMMHISQILEISCSIIGKMERIMQQRIVQAGRIMLELFWRSIRTPERF